MKESILPLSDNTKPYFASLLMGGHFGLTLDALQKDFALDPQVEELLGDKIIEDLFEIADAECLASGLVSEGLNPRWTVENETAEIKDDYSGKVGRRFSDPKYYNASLLWLNS